MTTDPQASTIDPSAAYTAFDIHFSRFIAGLDREAVPAVQTAAAMLSRAVRSGNSCLDLSAVAGDRPERPYTPAPAPGLEEWVSLLLLSRSVGRPGQQCPLILDQKNRLYLYRYWRYETHLAEAISNRVGRSLSDFDPAASRRALARYFPSTGTGETDWQKAAAVIALSNAFSVITGGPGTGKTFTIARLLALYCELNPEAESRIHLAAPTGKAAARLKASVAAAKARLDPSPQIAACVPDDVHTLHRLLRILPGSTGAYYHAGNPLPTDLLVVDEASMVDLALMSRLMAALPQGARIILAGDRDQLASVEAGSVFGDICHRQGFAGYSQPQRRSYEDISGEPFPPGLLQSHGTRRTMSDTIAVLRQNYRFDPDTGLGALNRAVRDGESANVLKLLEDPAHDSVQWFDYHAGDGHQRTLAARLIEGFRGCLEAESARAAVREMSRFQVLCALRRGPYGAEGINRLTESLLTGCGLIDPEETEGRGGYRGRPVMITRNDYELQLFNGDIGLVWSDGEPGAPILNTWFPDAEGGFRKIWPHQLPAHETVYAMTVHKSQGSEFDHVILLLPPHDHDLLTRELIYTALTRARRSITVWAPRSVLLKALGRRMRRSSGLQDALWASDF